MVGDIDSARAKGEKILAELEKSSWKGEKGWIGDGMFHINQGSDIWCAQSQWGRVCCLPAFSLQLELDTQLVHTESLDLFRPY